MSNEEDILLAKGAFLKAQIKSLDAIKKLQDICPHLKPNGTTAINGQINNYVCAYCNKEFNDSTLPDELKHSNFRSKVGSGTITVTELSPEEHAAWSKEWEEVEKYQKENPLVTAEEVGYAMGIVSRLLKEGENI